jgi:hypothetical protein
MVFEGLDYIQYCIPLWEEKNIQQFYKHIKKFEPLKPWKNSRPRPQLALKFTLCTNWLQEPHSIRLDVERLTALLRAHPAAAVVANTPAAAVANTPAAAVVANTPAAAAVANTPAAAVANTPAAAVANTQAAAVDANTTGDCLNIVFNNYRCMAYIPFVHKCTFL